MLPDFLMKVYVMEIAESICEYIYPLQKVKTFVSEEQLYFLYSVQVIFTILAYLL